MRLEQVADGPWFMQCKEGLPVSGFTQQASSTFTMWTFSSAQGPCHNPEELKGL